MMGYELVWSEENLEDVRGDWGSAVAERLEKVLEEKKEQIRWKESVAGLTQRVHRVFGVDGLTVAELSFTAQGGDYRAICIVVPEDEEVVYYTTVPKRGDLQRRELQLLRKNAAEIKQSIQSKSGRGSP